MLATFAIYIFKNVKAQPVAGKRIKLNHALSQ